MSKELPYFRFTSFEWLNGDISLESFEAKGVFIDICAYYWFKDCSITQAMLEKRFSNASSIIKALLNLGILKLKNGDDYIEISFNQIGTLDPYKISAGRAMSLYNKAVEQNKRLQKQVEKYKK